MPVKRRGSKRRLDPIAEARAWACAFQSQFDFFGDLEEFGLTDDRAVLEAMPDAWRRLGRVVLHNGMADDNGKPWALEQFGEPPCR